MAMYLKKKDGQEFGPVDLDVMKEWAAQGRVEPTDVVSEDRDSWKPAPEYEELGMDWVVHQPDGQEYGPVNASALANLLQEEIALPGTRVHQKNEQSGVEEDRPAGPAGKELTLEGLIKSNAILEREAAHWREMYESTAVEARRREDQLTARLKEADQFTSPQGEGDDRSNMPGPEGDLSLADLKQKFYALHREASKWRLMYEQEQAGARAREDDLQARMKQCQESETEMRGLVTTTAQRLAAVEKNYAALMQATETMNGDGDVSLAGQLGSLLQAYTDLSQGYDALQDELEQRNRELAAAQEAHRELERLADERFSEMEEMVCRAQEDAERARRNLGTLQASYQQLVRSYRDMNDRFIAWRQKITGGPSGPGRTGV